MSEATSLFDYASGTTTATFTNRNWPAEESAACVVEGQTPKAPMGRAAAEALVVGIVDPILRANAIYDIMLTGEPTFAKTYLLTQQIQTNTTAVRLIVSKDTSKHKDSVTFTATVTRKFSTAQSVLTGSVKFTEEGKTLAEVKLDANGRAVLTTTDLEVGKHEITATFTPDSNADSTAFSSSASVTHVVIGDGKDGSILHHWWFWLIILLVIVGLILMLRRKK